MAFLSQLQYMSTVEAAEAAAAAPSITDWAQTIVTIIGIIIAAAVAVRVAANQHDRQVLHQTKKDVADALVALDAVKEVFLGVKLFADIFTGQLEDHEREEMREAVEGIEEPIQRLASLVRLLELTAPDLIALHARNLLREVREFRGLMMISRHAYVRAEIKRNMGQPEPLGRLTTKAEYEAKHTSLEAAEMLLELATKDFENPTSGRHRAKIFFMVIWFRGAGFVKKQWKRAMKGDGAGRT